LQGIKNTSATEAHLNPSINKFMLQKKRGEAEFPFSELTRVETKKKTDVRKFFFESAVFYEGSD